MVTNFPHSKEIAFGPNGLRRPQGAAQLFAGLQNIFLSMAGFRVILCAGPPSGAQGPTERIGAGALEWSSAWVRREKVVESLRSAMGRRENRLPTRGAGEDEGHGRSGDSDGSLWRCRRGARGGCRLVGSGLAARRRARGWACRGCA